MLVVTNKQLKKKKELAILWDSGTFRKLILQTHMRSHPVGATCLIFGRARRLLPYFMCANSKGSGETARIRRLAWAFAGRLCDKYHNLSGAHSCCYAYLFSMISSLSMQL